MADTTEYDRSWPKSEKYLLSTGDESRLVQDALNRIEPSSIEFSSKPTWGISDLRDAVTTTGTGASVSEAGGAAVLDSGTDGTGVAQLQTLERGQYRPENVGQVGMRVRVPTLPTGSQDAKWLYFDDQNGFGFGVDANGIYVFTRKAGTTDKTYQGNWNVDPLDGSGRSDLALDLDDGLIFRVRFRWYGNGPTRWYIDVPDASKNTTRRVLVHRETVRGELSIVDPNQPLTARVENGGTASSLTMRVGGRQFSLRGGKARFNQRPVPEQVEGVALGSDGFTPLIAIRRKANHGTSGRANSVRVTIREVEVLADQLLTWKLSYGETITADSTAGWSAPTGWTDAESAIETQVQDGNLTADESGLPVERGRVPATQNKATAVDEQSELVLGGQTVAVLFGKRPSGTNTTVNSATVKAREQW